MSKRSVFTTISPLPADIPRDVVVKFLHNHLEMIDLNPLVKERHPIKPPADAPEDELKCIWYSLTDRITYLPGGLASGDISYTCAFHDLPDGIQTHCRAPLGVDIREKWTLGGTLPGEPAGPVELGIGAPATGLYIREDVDLRCNLLMTGFVKKNLKKSHATLVDHLVEKARHATTTTTTTTASSSFGDKDSLRTGQSPSSAADEKPALFPSSSSPSQASQNQQQPPRHSGRETPSDTTTRRSPPPQLGSPFVPGYQPSMRYPSPNMGEQQRHNAPPPMTHYRSHSQSTISPSRLDPQQQHHLAAAWSHPAAHALSHPHTRPQQQQPPHHRYSQPPPPAAAFYHDHDTALYPQPLRVRNTSVGSYSAHVTQPIPGAATTTTAARTSSYRSSGSFSSSSGSAPPTAATSSGGGDDDHPEYPSLNPYSDFGGGPDEEPTPPPRAPLVFAELAGSEGLMRVAKGGGGGAAADVYRNHPSVLRPGGRPGGMGARLDSPFTAELE